MISRYDLEIEQQVSMALEEDLGGTLDFENDITAMLIDSDTLASAKIITREDIVVCGIAWAEQAFKTVDENISVSWQCKDGEHLNSNKTLVEIKGNAQAILTAERTALNFLQMLSATATTTAKYTQYLSESKTRLLDTRKTIPGFRQAQKYAVMCGGGSNHRMGLYDAYLIKENHISACGGIENAIQKARQLHPGKTIEVEVENLNELSQAISANADIVMLDNFDVEQIHEAVSINNQQCKLEVSGNITEERLAELAETGIDFVSSGAITKNISAVDLSLLFI